MAALRSFSIDTTRLVRQFSGLQGRHPGLWPALPRGLLFALLFCALVTVGWLLYWQSLFQELEAGRLEEETLKAQFNDKIKQAVNLEALRTQREQVFQYVSQLQKQLPSKAEMDALLSDINKGSVGRGAQLQLFKPGAVVAKEYYAELPIAVKVVGNYHDLGAFASDISNLPRIVTLNNLSIVPQEKSQMLVMDATAKTFRYLDAEEIQRQRAAAQTARPGAKP